MAKKPLSPAQAAALAKGRAKRDENRQKQTPSTQTVQEPSAQPAPQLLTFTPEQLQQLVAALTTNSSVVVDKAPAPAFGFGAPGRQMNHLGQVVGVEQKYDIDPTHYPNPIERLYDDFQGEVRTRRLGLRDNYFITWDIDSKPYENKFGLSIQEPFFHATLYQHMWDEEGNELDDFIVVQTLHFNEDEGIAYDWAATNGFDVTPESMKHLMDEARYFRVKQWLLDLFFPPRNFELRQEAREEAIGGSVVKVVTKSNVKGFGNSAPKIKDEELS